MVKAVLSRSQCWCIDGNSIFALRVRADTYYRIELPYETEEDKKLAEELKSVFASILRYEKTACPFRRGFDVEFPESDEIIPRSGRWKNTEKARRWTLNKIWKPEDEPDYIPVCDRLTSPLTKETKGDSERRRNLTLKGNDKSEEFNYSNDETISSLAYSLSRSRSMQQDWLASSPLLVRRTRSDTPPPIKHSPSSFDARRRPFLKSAAKRPVSMYDESSLLNNGMPKEQSDAQNMSDSGPDNRSSKTQGSVYEELGHEAQISKSNSATPSEMKEEFDEPEVPRTSIEDKSSDEHEKQPPVEEVEPKSWPSASPPLTPPALSDSEESFSPTWTEEIITPPDTLRLRQAITRPHIRDSQSIPPSPTTSVPEIKSREEQGPDQQVESFPSNPLATDSLTEPPLEAAIVTDATPVTPTPSTRTLSTTTAITETTETAPPLSSPSSSLTTIATTHTSTTPTDLRSILSSPQGRSLGLIQKAYIILVSPPTHVFALMYEIATRLAASSTLLAKDEDDDEDEGEGMQVKGRSQRQRQQRQRREGDLLASRSLPGTWIVNEDEDEDDVIDVDDYGIPMGSSWQNGNKFTQEEEEEEKEEQAAGSESEPEPEPRLGQKKERAAAMQSTAAAMARTSLSGVD